MVLKACVLGKGGDGVVERRIKGALKKQDESLYLKLFPHGGDVEDGVSVQSIASLLPYLGAYIPLSGRSQDWISVLLFSISLELTPLDAILGVLRGAVGSEDADFAVESLCEALEGGKVGGGKVSLNEERRTKGWAEGWAEGWSEATASVITNSPPPPPPSAGPPLPRPFPLFGGRGFWGP